MTWCFVLWPFFCDFILQTLMVFSFSRWSMKINICASQNIDVTTLSAVSCALHALDSVSMLGWLSIVEWFWDGTAQNTTQNQQAAATTFHRVFTRLNIYDRYDQNFLLIFLKCRIFRSTSFYVHFFSLLFFVFINELCSKPDWRKRRIKEGEILWQISMTRRPKNIQMLSSIIIICYWVKSLINYDVYFSNIATRALLSVNEYTLKWNLL